MRFNFSTRPALVISLVISALGIACSSGDDDDPFDSGTKVDSGGRDATVGEDASTTQDATTAEDSGPIADSGLPPSPWIREGDGLTSATIRAVSANGLQPVSPVTVHAVTSDGTVLQRRSQPGSWEAVTTGATGPLSSVFVDVSGNASIAGAGGFQAAFTSVPPSPTPAWVTIPATSTADLNGTAFTVLPTGSYVFSVGEAGTILICETSNSGLPCTTASGASGRLSAIAEPNDDGVTWIAGAGGSIYVNSAAALTDFTPESSGTQADLHGVWADGATVNSRGVFAVGDGGVILHRNSDGSWSAEASPVSSDLLAVWGFSGAGPIYAVGEGGVVLVRDGSGTWTIEPSGTQADLHSVSGLVTQLGFIAFAVGEEGTILRRE